AIGYTFNPINRQYNNLSANIRNANFTATPAPVRQLRVVGGNATPGQNVTATVELVAQGDENSVGFSLNFDHTVLMNPTVVLAADALAANLIVNNSQAGAGKLGILLAMPAGQSFAAGTKSLVTVTFNTMATNLYNSPVTFGNVPIGKLVVNSNADPLTTNYLDGAVTFAQGWEADVTPRPTGKNNGSITVTDFTQVGRFVAGLDTPNSLHNEFQRADCAPRVSLGNGALDVADFTQAGRYAAAIDAVTSTGGQLAPRLFEFNSKGKLTIESRDWLRGASLNAPADNPDSAPTVVRVVNAQASSGSQVFVTIEAVTSGTENGFGFTLNYDPNKLSSPLIQKGADTQTATLIPNTTQAGKIGVVLGMPFDESVPSGTRHLITVRFNVLPNAPGGSTALTFSDAPVILAVADVNANTMQSTFQDGSVNILGPTAATASLGGRVRTTAGKGVRNAVVTVTFPNGETRTALSGSSGKYIFTDIPAGDTYIVSVAAKHYSFSQSSQIRQIVEDTLDVDFVADLPGLSSTFTPR
ncbi:MAG TPA: carboxypeptidase regulatory-like domain-containing protein, partial [Pyrinomonadaceae bacterium]|nr:carboxypeptidase regulatory-like domain-containing protein [Pyrinomonadaceae bacterium]